MKFSIDGATETKNLIINLLKMLLRPISRKLYSTKLDLSGIFPPITTPFKANEEIAYEKLSENISKLDKTEIKGYLVQGSNGEYCFLNPDERVEMIKRVRKCTKKVLLAGSGCESTAQTVEMSRRMAEVGADAVVVVTPSYFKAKMSSGSALVKHYESVADLSPIPVILYNVPANTGLDMSAETVAQLSQHENIIGVKESGGDVGKIAKMVHESQKGFQVLAGSAGFLLPALTVGAVGGICALANVLPNHVVQLQNGGGAQLQRELVLPNHLVTRGLGVPGLKTAMEWFGFYGGPCRKPLLPITEQEESQLKKAFQPFL